MLGLSRKTDKEKAALLQQEYVAKRGRKLNKRDEDKIKLVIERISALAAKKKVSLSQLATLDKEGWEVAYGRIADAMRAAPLTINFCASRWFGAAFDKTIGYSTYATTYQINSAQKDGKLVLKTQYSGKDIAENAKERLAADQKVTIPESWKDANRLHPQRRRLYKAMTTGKKDVGGGGFKMADYNQVDMGDGVDGYTIDNRRFNLDTRQVFAALNICSRPNGSNNFYGFSHLILKPALKNQAIYFPKDTFTVAYNDNAVDQQCTYETLGAVLAYCDDEFAEEIWDSCFLRHTCANTTSGRRMVEAHIFREVKMSEHVEWLHISRLDRRGNEIPMADFLGILESARIWARKNNVRFAG